MNDYISVFEIHMLPEIYVKNIRLLKKQSKQWNGGTIFAL